jgi:ribonuclease inhibitor
MKSCTIDGAELPDAVAVYRRLGEVLQAPAYFGANPDALWDAITEYSGEPVEILWRNAARSAGILGPHFRKIMTVLEAAAAEGRLKLRLE